MTRSILLTLCGVAAGLLLALAFSRGEVHAQAGGCAQWEVTLGTTTAPVMLQPTELGKPVVDKGPPGGWEPFAYNSGGSLVYRRCAR